MALEQIVDITKALIVNAFARFVEQSADESRIDIKRNLVKFKSVSTLIEWSRRRTEHLGHNASLAARKHKVAVLHLLDIATQQRFNILFGVMRDLLELVDGHDARLVGSVEIVENLLQSEFGISDVAQFHAKRRTTVQSVDADGATQRFQGLYEAFCKPFSSRNKLFIDTSSQIIGEFPQV